MDSELLVSICIPVYNAAKYLNETLNSIVNQTYTNKEIIISDNVSTDDSPRIVKQYMQKYDIHYSTTEKHWPIGEYNANHCVTLAKGDAVCIYHADDVYEPEIVVKCAHILKKYPNVGAVFTMANVINEKSEVFSRYSLPLELKRLARDYYHFDEIFRCVLKYENSFLICPSPMVRKSVYEQLGGFDYEKYRSASDLGLWFKIAQNFDIAIIDEPLLNVRISRGQGSYAIIRQRTTRADYFLVVDAYADKITGHKNSVYYHLSLMKDALYRALNLSAQERLNESQALAGRAMDVYFKDFRGLCFIHRAGIYFVIAVLLTAINKVPFPVLRKYYRAFIMKCVGMKKKVFSY